MRFSRVKHWLAAMGVLLVAALLCDAKLFRPGTVFTIDENIQIAEAQSWWNGRLDIPERKWDSALFAGKVYSHFPPLFSFLSAAITPFYKGVPHWFVLIFVVLPVPALGYAVCRRLAAPEGYPPPLPGRNKLTDSSSTGSAALHPWLHTVAPPGPKSKALNASHCQVRGSVFWSFVLAVGLVCGTSVLPVVEKALRGAGPYFVNQALALTGVLIFLREYFGKQRWWLAGLGIVMAAWSRQMTIAYLVPLGWMIFRFAAPAGAELQANMDNQGLRFASPLATNLGPYRGRSAGTRKRLMMSGTGVGLVALLAFGVPMGLNWRKFGNPVDSGYMHVYEGRTDDVFVRDAKQYGIFSPHYIPRNLYYTNLGFWSPQRIIRNDKAEWHIKPQLWGTGIWWTTPLLLFALWDWRAILRDPRRRMLLMAAGLAYIGLMVYHSTGYKQRGYNRYSLDYLPALFALAIPAALASPWRKVVAVCLIGWSVFYFAGARHWPQIRVW